MKKFLQRSSILLVAASLFFINVEAANPSSVPASNTKEAPRSEIKKALREFRKISSEEKQSRIASVNAEIKKYNEQKSAGQEPSTNTLLLAILAILLPPLAVYLHQGEINNKFWISLILTLLFWLPGVIYALLVIFGGV